MCKQKISNFFSKHQKKTINLHVKMNTNFSVEGINLFQITFVIFCCKFVFHFNKNDENGPSLFYQAIVVISCFFFSNPHIFLVIGRQSSISFLNPRCNTATPPKVKVTLQGQMLIVLILFLNCWKVF